MTRTATAALALDEAQYHSRSLWGIARNAARAALGVLLSVTAALFGLLVLVLLFPLLSVQDQFKACGVNHHLRQVVARLFPC